MIHCGYGLAGEPIALIRIQMKAAMTVDLFLDLKYPCPKELISPSWR